MKKIFIIIICLFLTGCYDYKEINDLGIISSILIDYNDTYNISLEIVNNDDNEIITCSGTSFDNALYKCDTSTYKHLSYSHLNAVLITNNVDIDELIYYFIRKNNVNNNFYLAYVNNNNIFNNSSNYGLNVFDILKKHNYQDFFDIAKDYINDYKDITLPIIDSNNLDFIIYKNNKVSFLIDNNEANMLDLLLNKDKITFDIKCDDSILSLNVNDIKLDYNIDKKITLNISLSTYISNNTFYVDTSNIDDIKYLEDLANKYISDNILRLLNILKNYKTDSLGLNKLINNKYKSLNNNFYDYDFKVNSNVHIYKKGLLLK